ncbi:MAG: tetratricopeptide repeat protein [bacterium]
MNRFCSTVRGNLWALLFFLAAASVFPGNILSQESAGAWFNTGLKAKNLEDKIQAFENAVRLDPDYVEAYYYLGLAYEKKGLNQKAKTALNKAYFKNPYALSNEIKTRILFELGNIHAALAEKKEAKDAYLGAKRLSKDPFLKGRIDYALGKLYLEDGDFHNALDALNEGKTFLPQNSDLFDKLISEAHSKKSVEEKYLLALRKMDSGRFNETIQLLHEVIQIDPNYKEASTRLREAEDALNRDTVNKKLNAWYQQAQIRVRNGRPAEAMSLLQKIVAVDPDFKDAAAQLQRLQKRLAEKSQTTASKQPRIQQFYELGLKAFQRQEWSRAMAQFKKVQSLNGSYKDVATLLQQARAAYRENVQRQQVLRQEAEKKRQLYEQGMTYKTAGNWHQALSTFKKLQKIDPNYPDLSAQIKSVQTALQQAQERKPDIETLYQQGSSSLQNGDWLQAMIAFEKVKVLNPAYKDVDNKLADAQFNFERSHAVEQQEVVEDTPHYLLILGYALSSLILPIFGVLTFSPATRARLYLLQGKYENAARIYEKMLLRHPGKIKLYPVLANIYLLENRRDEKALKVFEMVLRLNLTTQQQREINTIMANHYLTQGRTDDDAIKIMERELDLNRRQV